MFPEIILTIACFFLLFFLLFSEEGNCQDTFNKVVIYTHTQEVSVTGSAGISVSVPVSVNFHTLCFGQTTLLLETQTQVTYKRNQERRAHVELIHTDKRIVLGEKKYPFLLRCDLHNQASNSRRAYSEAWQHAKLTVGYNTL